MFVTPAFLCHKGDGCLVFCLAEPVGVVADSVSGRAGVARSDMFSVSSLHSSPGAAQSLQTAARKDNKYWSSQSCSVGPAGELDRIKKRQIEKILEQSLE